MNNWHFDVTAEGRDALIAAMKLAFKIAGCEGTTIHDVVRGATHYAVRKPKKDSRASIDFFDTSSESPRLIFFNHYNLNATGDDKIALPFRLDAEGAADFARRWLDEVSYPKQPDIDGSVHKGWRVFNEEWGRVDGDHTSVIAVSPTWAMYGK